MTIPAIALSRGPLRVDIEMPMFDSAKYNVSDHHETYGSLENMKSNQDVTDMQSSNKVRGFPKKSLRLIAASSNAKLSEVVEPQKHFWCGELTTLDLKCIFALMPYHCSTMHQ